MRIDPSERWIIIGKTGSGKTEFCKYLLREVAKKWPVIIIDPKELWLGKGKGRRAKEWAQGKDPGTIDKPHLVRRFNPKFRVQCIQPEDMDEDGRLASLSYRLLKMGDRFYYIDETEGLATATMVPLYLRKIWKTGRAWNIGAWACSQTPSGIPRIFKSQAEHFIVFKVGEQDAELASELVKVTPEEIRALRRYEYFYYNTDMERGEWHAPIPLEKK
jgi:DNA helicase HerA-like ATPase